MTGKQPPTQALPEAGSLTILGHSAEERFRITYEARQLLHKVFAGPETPIVGSVGRGLLVVPGQWARLSNISEDDQQLWLGWQALRWAMQKKGLGLPEDGLSVNMVDPGLSYMLRQHPEDQREVRLQAILHSTKPFRSALLPVYASDHWTLLVCHKESAEQASGFTWKLYDSLSVPMKAQQEAQILLGSLLDSEFVLPERANSAVQPEGSNLCGWYCLSYAEQEVRLLRKEWLRMHASELAPTWKERLLKLSTHLQKELGLREKELATMAEKAQKAKTEAEKRAQVNKKALEAMKDLTSVAAKTAQEALKKNTLRFTWEDLSKEALAKISALEHSPKICARCRWQSSCLSCDPYKALRYWVASEARDKKKIPSVGGLLREFLLHVRV